MKWIIAALIILLFVLQYQLWFAKGGLLTARVLRSDIEKQKIVNNRLREKNNRLKVEIKALKQGRGALEEHARNDLGMVKKDETFYQVVKHGDDNGAP